MARTSRDAAVEARVGCGRTNLPQPEGRRRFPAELHHGRRRDTMTSDVPSDPIARNGRSVGDVSEVEPPQDGAVLRDKPGFEPGRSCTYLARAISEPLRLAYFP